MKPDNKFERIIEIIESTSREEKIFKARIFDYLITSWLRT